MNVSVDGTHGESCGCILVEVVDGTRGTEPNLGEREKGRGGESGFYNQLCHLFAFAIGGKRAAGATPLPKLIISDA